MDAVEDVGFYEGAVGVLNGERGLGVTGGFQVGNELFFGGKFKGALFGSAEQKDSETETHGLAAF